MPATQPTIPICEKLHAETLELFPKLVEIRRDFHRYPELSNREVRTSQIVAKHLHELGIPTKTQVAHHGVIGLIEGSKPGPVVAVRADMDALPIVEARDVPYKSQTPGVMHACGHDVHTTIGLGTAELLVKHRAELRGSVKLLFQPCEEGAPPGEEGGAKLMIQEGALCNPKPEAIFGLHCVPTIEVGKLGYNEAAAMASADRFEITIRGNSTHGAYPHKGTDTIVVASTAVLMLQTIRSRMIDAQEPMVLSIGSFHAGNRNNIIAGEVKLEGTVRALNESVRVQTKAMIHQILKGVTEGSGAEFELVYEERVPVLINHTELVHRMLPTMRQVVGEHNVLNPKPRMGAEDFSHFANEVPGFFYSLGVANQKRGITAMIHTPNFDVDEDCILIGVKTMTAMVLDYGIEA